MVKKLQPAVLPRSKRVKTARLLSPEDRDLLLDHQRQLLAERAEERLLPVELQNRFHRTFCGTGGVPIVIPYSGGASKSNAFQGALMHLEAFALEQWLRRRDILQPDRID